MQRREFLKKGTLAGIGALIAPEVSFAQQEKTPRRRKAREPVVVSTWSHGLAANRVAYILLQVSGTALDAAEHGVKISEADPKVTSVGFGGFPNRDGVVELDAAIMVGTTLQAGSVASLKRILHPISVARRVMEKTRHVMLVGEGALKFALSQGFEEENLLTPEAEEAWKKWRASPHPKVPGQGDGHDTIGMVTMDRGGRLAAACTTSGLSWKLPGRVGDSPLIGSGLYCDDQAGGAAATGIGEEVIKVCGSYQVVEFMRQGLPPNEAIRRVLKRILDRETKNNKRMIAFVALRKDGEVGFGSTIPGFQAAVSRNGKHKLENAPSVVSKTGKKETGGGR